MHAELLEVLIDLIRQHFPTLQVGRFRACYSYSWVPIYINQYNEPWINLLVNNEKASLLDGIQDPIGFDLIMGEDLEMWLVAQVKTWLAHNGR